MSMTESDTRRVKAYRRSADLPPIMSQEEFDRRSEARAMADDLRQTSVIQSVEDRLNIIRGGASEGSFRYPARKTKQPLCAGWWVTPAAALGLFLWVAGIAQVLDMMRNAGWL